MVPHCVILGALIESGLDRAALCCSLLAAVLAGGVAWRTHEDRLEERARGEAARQQVLTALRITSHALNQMNMQLAAHRRDGQDQ